MNTKPSRFESFSFQAAIPGYVPSVEELANQLKAQLERINEVPASMLDQKLKQPILGLETFGELANMALFHESYHLGQIHAMKKLVK